MSMPVDLRRTFDAAVAKAAEVEAELHREMAVVRATLERARDDHEATLADRDRVAAALARAKAEADRFAAIVAEKQAELAQAVEAFEAQRIAARQTLDAERAERERAEGRASSEVKVREETQIALINVQGRLEQTSRRLEESGAEIERLGAQLVQSQAVHRADIEALARAAGERERISRRLEDFDAETPRLGEQVNELARKGVNAPVFRFANRREAIAALRVNGARDRLRDALSLDHEGRRDRKAIFALHKCATMFIWRLMDFISDTVGVRLRSPNGVTAEYFWDEVTLPGESVNWANEYGWFGPFRGHISLDWSLFSKLTVVVRDPRDILVSMFFSWAISHPVGGENGSLLASDGTYFNPTDEQRQAWFAAGIDAFVLEYAPIVERNMRGLLQDLASQPQATLLFYEDFVADPKAWMMEFLLAQGCAAADIEELLPSLIEEFGSEFEPPNTEEPSSHRRQMKAGDHRRKLQPATVDALTERFSFYFESTRRDA